MTAKELWALIEQDGLHGPWSRSDQFDHIGRCIAYAAAKIQEREPVYLRADALRTVLEIVSDRAWRYLVYSADQARDQLNTTPPPPSDPA